MEDAHRKRCLDLLSNLLLKLERQKRPDTGAPTMADSGSVSFEQLYAVATSHHVIMRAFPALAQMEAGADGVWSKWAADAMQAEQSRIQIALSFLGPICRSLGEIGETLVIKSLDHWPDLGSDLDIYSTAPPKHVVALMRDRFQARIASRSWGDRLANKWNFIIPGLPELVEIHIGRLGQMGEQVAFAERLTGRAEQFGQHVFPVPRPEDRIIISTLQRMYRHFYLRLCDIADLAQLLESREISYVYLESAARAAGLWEGLATYLVIVSGYVKQYRTTGLTLPPSVERSARFHAEKISFRHNFLRIPIFPEATGLFTKEWASLFAHKEIRNALRLSMLPGLATAAALSFKLAGQDKGIW